MAYRPENPVIVQSDRSILLEVERPLYEEARDALAQFAELEKSPDYVHTYRVTPLSLWNAASAGLNAEQIIESLQTFSKYDIPQNVLLDIHEYVGRYGRLRLLKEGDDLILESGDRILVIELQHQKSIQPYIQEALSENRLRVDARHRGLLKQALIKIGYPVEDVAGYVEGAALAIELRETTLTGRDFGLRTYQNDAVGVYYAAGTSRGGSGVLVLPCGAGKTIIGIAAMAKIQQHTLVLTTNITALRQWRDELIDKTTLDPELIGEYSGESKQIRPVTLTTYQILTFRKHKDQDFIHMGLFNNEAWGLIIYDEVHLLPAPVFRAVADIQGKRRLGLTATLVREDGKEDDVFSLIGPKKYDVPWKQLEIQGWIAKAECVEIRVPLPEEKRLEYAVADAKSKFRLASENPAKLDIIRRLIEKHHEDNILVIGQYIEQLELIAAEFGAPIITGKTPSKEREVLYAKFKTSEIKLLIVSKVANFAIDLPDANVAIQVSGTFGSRQEEAQRLGRVLRPKGEGIENIAHFYSVVTRDTKDQDFAQNRQLFLTEQGYRYRVELEELKTAPSEGVA
jgi:DNA excision repair protein ERCC-3